MCDAIVLAYSISAPTTLASAHSPHAVICAVSGEAGLLSSAATMKYTAAKGTKEQQCAQYRKRSGQREQPLFLSRDLDEPRNLRLFFICHGEALPVYVRGPD
jgi:hypothetical protein